MGDRVERVAVLSDRVCECGCGERTMVSPRTKREKGWVKGEGRRFVKGHNGGGGFPVRCEYVVNELTGCWVWQRGVNEKGYGVLAADGRARVKAHRLYFERYVGVIPDGLDVHHRCSNRRCVNPEHLELVEHGAHSAEHARARYASR